MKRIAIWAVVCLGACAVRPEIYDEIFIEIEDFSEYVDEYGRVGRVVLSVMNTTNSPIYSGTISLRLKTDGGAYYTTIHDEDGVPPDTKVFLTVEFFYLAPEEHSSASEVTIIDYFFI